MNHRYTIPFRPRQAPEPSPDSEVLSEIAASLREIVALLKSERKPDGLTEDDAIARLIHYVQVKGLPTMSQFCRDTGIARRQLQPDRWPRFRELYDRLAGMERGVDRARMVDCQHDDDEDGDTG